MDDAPVAHMKFVGTGTLVARTKMWIYWVFWIQWKESWSSELHLFCNDGLVI
ncbi:unnamed protein product [Musa textilis]